MAFFSFSLIKDSFVYLSTNIEPNKKYYSKDIALSKELNNKNKINSFAELNYETRIAITNVGKKLVADYAIKKLGVDGIKANLIKSTLGSSFMSLNNPITAALNKAAQKLENVLPSIALAL